jgi:hypothetical protein
VFVCKNWELIGFTDLQGFIRWKDRTRGPRIV